MSAAYNADDQKAEDNAARLAAALLKQYGLGIDCLFTHTHWLNVRDGVKGDVDTLNTKRNPYKYCPAYILPHWEKFKAKVQAYLEDDELYRVRKTWDDAKSQTGAFKSLDNAKKSCATGYSVFDEDGDVVHSNAEKSYAKGMKVTLKSFCKNKHGNRENPNDDSALFQQTFQFVMILCTKMITNDRCRSNRISNECGKENHIDVHQYTVSGNAILACIFHQLHIVQHTDNGHGNIAHQLRRTICAGFQQCSSVKSCFC